MQAGKASSLVTVWRPSEAEGALASRTTTYAEVGTTWVRFTDGRPGLQNYGAGEAPAGTIVATVRWTASVQARDVLEVTQGPHMGETWKVEGIDAARPDSVATLKRVTVRLPG
ncbi:MAG TPA: hypothetical protein VFJ16_24820 [Longimicrobium sp.]|nr:hypothetical protein [Longimicrobium sp.]